MEDFTNKHPQLPISNHHTPTASPLRIDQERPNEDRMALLHLAGQVKKLIKREKARDQKIMKMQSTIDTLMKKIVRVETESSGGVVGIEEVKKEQDDSSEGELSAISTETKAVLDRVFPCLPVSSSEPSCYPDTTLGSQIIENASLEDAGGEGVSTRDTLGHGADPFAHLAIGTNTVICREKERVKSPDIRVKREDDDGDYKEAEEVKPDTMEKCGKGGSPLVHKRRKKERGRKKLLAKRAPVWRVWEAPKKSKRSSMWDFSLSSSVSRHPRMIVRQIKEFGSQKRDL
ncbi:hypothetical protein C7212DRAFT_360667 [Tuber magnatum]|uniref:Uncharacterized protein n=1 Tax=Tuber magnatum TaxID=42249 RepID=A0A317T169_9PEZI|nr:hypothetical protein C7212DRAFT_360667 [Tuber magnatum]